ncbi:MAG: hypothetical protein H0U66_12605 [Gemmatimonadaceae bacterium]|nr:hypothetical protein [Gemmatimonadaceae bacterium]
MTHASGRSNRFVLAALALMCVGAVACHDAESTAPKTVPTPQGPMLSVGTVMVHVDMKHHRITTSPISGSPMLAPGVSGRFFGAPTTEIEYALSEQPFTDLGATDIEYNIHAGFSNLLDFAIGTNSPHTYPSFPQDTMGVYMYFIIAPANITSLSGPCSPPTCTVTIDSVDGAYPFSSTTPQPYVFFKTILETGGLNAQRPGPFKTDQSAIGGINYFRTMSFHTHGNVTDFTFGLSMAAAWVEPRENRWKVFYIADSLPNRTAFPNLRSEPDWRVLGTGGGVSTIQPANCTFGSGCKLRLVSTTASASPETLLYYRSDSLRASQSAYIAATTTSSIASASPSIFLGLKDPDKLVQMGISTTLTGFTDSTGAFIPGSTVATNLGRTSYRVSKTGTTNASIFSPANSAVPLKTISYTSLPAAPGRGVNPGDYDRFFFFGNVTQPTTAADATSLWTDVNYEIGVAGP